MIEAKRRHAKCRRWYWSCWRWKKIHTHTLWCMVLCACVLCVDVWRALVFRELYADYAIREHHVQNWWKLGLVTRFAHWILRVCVCDCFKAGTANYEFWPWQWRWSDECSRFAHFLNFIFIRVAVQPKKVLELLCKWQKKIHIDLSRVSFERPLLLLSYFGLLDVIFRALDFHRNFYYYERVLCASLSLWLIFQLESLR